MPSHQEEEYLVLHTELIGKFFELTTHGHYEARSDRGTEILRIFPLADIDGHEYFPVMMLAGEAEGEQKQDLYLAGTIYLFDEFSPLVTKDQAGSYTRNALTDTAQTSQSAVADEEAFGNPEVSPEIKYASLDDLRHIQSALSEWMPYRL